MKSISVNIENPIIGEAAGTFKGYPESLVRCLVKNDAAKKSISSREYYDSRKHDNLEFYPFVYVGKNFKKIIQDVICDVSSEIVFESIKSCDWNSISAVDRADELNDDYSSNHSRPVMFNFSVKIDGKKYGFSLRWDMYHVSDVYQLSKYPASDSFENRIKLLEMAEEVRKLVSNTSYAKELAVQDFINMCRGIS